MIDRNILIVAETARAIVDDPEWVIVDCRFKLDEPDAGLTMYDHGHIPSAVFLDLDRDLAGTVKQDSGRHPLPDVGNIVARLRELGIGNSHKILVYDADTGALAARAWWILRWLGHEQVYLLDGGMEHWQKLDYPLESSAVSRAPGTFTARTRDELVLTTSELAANITAIAEARLVDARDAARFRGDEEPIDPIAGHVPGARNAPFTTFVHGDGRWRSIEERRALLLDALDGDPDGAWSVMCGSGVTACHLAISAIEAGLSEPRVYVGSWSEWIRAADRPIGTGEG